MQSSKSKRDTAPGVPVTAEEYLIVALLKQHREVFDVAASGKVEDYRAASALFKEKVDKASASDRSSAQDLATKDLARHTREVNEFLQVKRRKTAEAGADVQAQGKVSIQSRSRNALYCCQSVPAYLELRCRLRLCLAGRLGVPAACGAGAGACWGICARATAAEGPRAADAAALPAGGCGAGAGACWGICAAAAGGCGMSPYLIAVCRNVALVRSSRVLLCRAASSAAGLFLSMFMLSCCCAGVGTIGGRGAAAAAANPLPAAAAAAANPLPGAAAAAAAGNTLPGAVTDVPGLVSAGAATDPLAPLPVATPAAPAAVPTLYPTPDSA